MKGEILMRHIYPMKPKKIQPLLHFPPKVFEPNSASISSSLQSCIESNHPLLGQRIHSFILKTGFPVNTNISIKLLILHLRCGCLSYARQMFDQMHKPTVSSYNSMIAGYFKHGRTEESLNLIRKLTSSGEMPDVFTISMVLKFSTSLMSLNLGKSAHAQILKLGFEVDDVLFTALVDSYSKNGKVDYARRVYDMMSERNLICSTAMISGYMQTGTLESAEEIFQDMLEKDDVVFNAMIEGYSKTMENASRSLELYIDMQRLNFRPTISTFASVIGACSVLSAFEISQQVHGQIVKADVLSHVKSGSALIDMYCKCGRTEDARRIFDYMPEKNVFSWTSMIDGYGKNGSPDKALLLFDMMRKDRKIKPNYVTFLSALSACGHAGLVSAGKEIFEGMEKEYSLKPRMEHYACIVDLLGRAGSLHQALEFIKQMPERPGSDVWGALLGACRLHEDVELADFAANEIFKLSKERRPGAYVALSNTFAAAGKWDGVCQVRELMKQRSVSKDAGCSWVGVDNVFCDSYVG